MIRHPTFSYLKKILLNFHFREKFEPEHDTDPIVPVVIVSVVILALASSVAAFFIWRKIKRDKLGRTGNSMHTTATKPEEEKIELNEELVR